MTNSDIVRRRLHNQHLVHPSLEDPGELVRWLGAVQSQDYLSAKWALGLRLRDATDQSVEAAFAAGSILRTHVLRPTWHFVAPEDIRWMLALTAPRVNAASAYQHRKEGLDQEVFGRSNAALVKALRDGGERTRDELRAELDRAGIRTEGEQRMTYIMMRAELDGLVVSGGRRGRQFTYALLEERVPPAKALTRDEALVALADRFFRSHGPATARDFAKWSGLALSDARRGLEEVKSALEHDMVDGNDLWFSTATPPAAVKSPTAFLLPSFDEYTIGYRDHAAVIDGAVDYWTIYGNTVVIDGRVTGTWKRTLKRDEVLIEWNFFASPTNAETLAVTEAAERYGRFLGLAVTIV